ncbi:hypothetical protein CEW89_08600 [Celeribacter ethanolicus]|uniref:Uncharacterized protein n=1 Tax=Celeribacter ethanolicus TaxID=1758178 RepID=A0A291GBV9_9RHOB|nr:hypothetical protein [Celeribacter ethanolicus]ATG47628.1 hypothetical protein CEW89_08600 [Celeribacter ethanolicus]
MTDVSRKIVDSFAKAIADAGWFEAADYMRTGWFRNIIKSHMDADAERIAALDARVKAADEHLVAALEAIIEGYPRSDISHEDFRVQVTHWAEDAIAEYRKTEAPS